MQHMKNNQRISIKKISTLFCVFGKKQSFFLAVFIVVLLIIFTCKYSTTSVYIAPDNFLKNNQGNVVLAVVDQKITPTETLPKPFVATHIVTPKPVKGIYMSACVAATPSFRAKLVKLINETELNAVIIDIKDYSGTLSFGIDDPLVKNIVGDGCKVADMRDFIQSLHKKNIYVIGRITVFQDPLYVKLYPKFAVKKSSATSVVWADYKGLNFIDVGAKDYWKYIVAISKASYKAGFDELNYDYIRFPSDGNMNDIYYPFSEMRITTNPEFGKAEVLKDFFAYLYDEMKDTKAILSADLFGMTMTNPDDLNIGQILEQAAPYFDYIAPMVYPSHYPSGFNNYQNVNKYPYEIVKYSMDEGVKRLTKMANSTTTPIEGRGSVSKDQLRPWLQDNNYPVVYTPAMVRAQIKATYDAGLDSWMLWDAGNTYTHAALEMAE
ncbi:putative glycoside hydrolase [Patescibacteria group bacterium]|nr:putative glycoside hydrolase [Patescibacteria group bacterium]